MANSIPADEPVPMVFSSTDRDHPPVKLGDGCKIRIAPVNDVRRNKQTVGYSFAGAFATTGIDTWLRSGLATIGEYGYPVADGESDAAPDDGLLIRASVAKTYTWFVGFKIFGMLVVNAEFADRSGVIQSKTYRAFGDKTNVWGAQSELQTTLNYTVNNLLPLIALDLQKLCRRETVAAYTFGGPEVGATLGTVRQ
jgi:hypothetical protein